MLNSAYQAQTIKVTLPDCRLDQTLPFSTMNVNPKKFSAPNNEKSIAFGFKNVF